MSAPTAEKRPFLPVRGASRAPQAPLLPQVNLLPPEVHSSRQLSATKRRLALTPAGVLVVVGLGYGYGSWRVKQADDELAAAEHAQTSLQSQIGQYRDVTQLLSEIDQVGAQRTEAMKGDVTWRSYLDAIAAVLPAGVSIDSAAVAGPSLSGASSGSAVGTSVNDPLATAGIGSIALTLRSATVPDSAALIDALAGVKGLASPTVSTVSLTAGTDSASPYYAVTATVTVTSDALSHRFDKQGN